MRSAEARNRAACGPVRNAMRKMRGNSAPGAKPDVQRLVDRSVRRRADVIIAEILTENDISMI